MADDVATDDYDDEDEARVFSILSGTSRRNRWRVSAFTDILTVFGRTFLDLRQADADGDLVSMRIWCVFGSVTILVPEGCDVRPSGMAFLASSDSLVPEIDEPTSFPALDIEANVVFGRIRVRTALGDDAPGALPVEQPVRRTVAAGAAPAPAVAPGASGAPAVSGPEPVAPARPAFATFAPAAVTHAADAAPGVGLPSPPADHEPERGDAEVSGEPAPAGFATFVTAEGGHRFEPLEPVGDTGAAVS